MSSEVLGSAVFAGEEPFDHMGVDVLSEGDVHERSVILGDDSDGKENDPTTTVRSVCLRTAHTRTLFKSSHAHTSTQGHVRAL
jgi:hypothetical protein